MRVLVVDDQATMRRIIIRMLERLGVDEWVEADSGQEALRAMEHAPVDLVITDWSMPRMNGLEFLHAVQANPRTRGVPVIMVTSHGAKDDVVTAMRAGVVSYIIKPFTASGITERIGAVLDKLAVKQEA
jgi:two-component system chemotaxis response regulator CheY